eukprot:gene4739-5795_t
MTTSEGVSPLAAVTGNVFGDKLANSALGAEDISEKITSLQTVASLLQGAEFFPKGQVTLECIEDPERPNVVHPDVVLQASLAVLVSALLDRDIPHAVSDGLYAVVLGEEVSKASRSSSRNGTEAADSSPVVKSFVNRLEQAGGVAERVSQVLLKLLQQPQVGAPPVVDACLQAVRAKMDNQGSPPVLGVRLVQFLVGNIILGPATGLTLEKVMVPFVLGLMSNNADVRKASILGTVEAYRTAGNRVFPFLQECPKMLQEELNAAFITVDNEPKSSKPPSREIPGDTREPESLGNVTGGGEEVYGHNEVVPTREMLLVCSGQQTKKIPGETTDKFLQRLTHLALNEKGLTRIANLRPCVGLRVLYLYDNKISRLENLEFAQELTHLYLQNNEIESVDGLALRKLKKLYLDGNRIRYVKGLEGCENLEELNLGRQRLPRGEGLEFDRKTLEYISGSLCVLKAPNCGIKDLALPALECLTYLEELDLTNNQITHLEALESFMPHCQHLSEVDFRGNPVTKKPKYRNKVIIMSDRAKVHLLALRCNVDLLILVEVQVAAVHGVY